MLSMLERPTVLARTPRSLRQLVYGAAPISQDLIARWLKMFPDIDFIQGYGMTEAASVLTFLGPETTGAMRGARQQPAPRSSVSSFASPTRSAMRSPGRGGRSLRPRRQPHARYWEKPTETEEVLRDGWYHTGDMGFLDDGNLLHLTDRMKDMIVTGGENVYSIEVENAIASHPAVAEVAVIGIPSDTWGEAVHAIVVLQQGMKATAEDLIEHTRQFIGRVQGTQIGRIPGRSAPAVRRLQAFEARTAAALLGGQRTPGELSQPVAVGSGSQALPDAPKVGARAPFQHRQGQPPTLGTTADTRSVRSWPSWQRRLRASARVLLTARRVRAPVGIQRLDFAR